MIKDVKTLGEFLAAGRTRVLSTTIEPPDISCTGVEIEDGHLVIDQGLHLPVVGGVTSSNVFGMARPDRYPPMCARGLGPAPGEISDALFVHNVPNYYHFMTFELPQLLLLAGKGGARVSLVMRHPFLPTIADLMRRALVSLGGGREIEIALVPEGTYALKNVIVGTRQKSSLTPHMCRRLLIPLAFQSAGLTDPIKELGPVKLFVKRTNAGNGRDLTNQAQVEDWCIKRGYVAVSPGDLTMDEQIILFSRATHIVGVEGAAMTNLLFANNAEDVTVIASPAVADEKFFSAIAKHYPYNFQTIYGQIDLAGDDHVRRKADYRVVMDIFHASMMLKGLA